MSSSHAKRKKAQRRERAAEAAAAAARRQVALRRRKRIGIPAAAVAVVAIVIVIVAVAGGSTTKPKSKGTTTTVAAASSTTAAPLASAKGKPCLARSDPLPTGAPEVPVQVGPPPTSLVKQDLTPGTGAEVKAGDTVTVDYIGVACSTGRIFDSSYKTGRPATFPLGNVIKGWTDGIPGMKVGGRRLLGIPSDQAYGPSGSGSLIAPDEALWFVVDVKATKSA